ncbi:MAG TPA: GAF and ANTAR domain-containing protein [Acidimicrobiales bacterium]|jgi:GAF domain-containing protein|nr:GAF and ANTAR domain-containing protein [Acidimicrobiales bacterium]
MARESLLIATLVELADNLVDDYDVIDVLTVLSDRCVEAIDVDAAGVMLASPGGELQFVASSSESMRVLELFQIQADEGPCVDCYRSGQAIVNHSLSEKDGRWPHFTPLALAQGFRSVHSLPMRLRGKTIGALNLFRTTQGPMGGDDVVVAQGLADVATIAILQHRSSLDAHTLNEQLSNALNSRIVIEQAKGIISEAANCDMDHAFGRLRAHARNHNEGLTEVAWRLVEGTMKADNLDHPKEARSK